MEEQIHPLESRIQDIKELDNKESFNNTKDLQKRQNLECSMCDLKVTSARMLQRHLEGKKHKIRAAWLEKQGKEFICELCDVKANSEIQLNLHLQSFKHKSRLGRKERDEFTAVSPDVIGSILILCCLVCIFLNLFLLFRN